MKLTQLFSLSQVLQQDDVDQGRLPREELDNHREQGAGFPETAP